MSVIHFSYASDGGASRAGRRANLACATAGIPSAFAFVAGKPQSPMDVMLVAAAAPPASPRAVMADLLDKRLQWEYIPNNRTDLSNSLLSIPYPGLDAGANRLFAIADIIHLHWPSWGVTPAAIDAWLGAGRQVFWTLHDCWPMTGGCHYPAGCTQFASSCMKCPLLADDIGLVPNSFAEKRARYGSHGALTLIAPSAWIAGMARGSAIFRDRPVHVVRNPVELDMFAPPADRAVLRKAMGVGPDDLMLLLGSFDLLERRKGVALMLEALRGLGDGGALAETLPAGARIHLAMFGKSPPFDEIPGLLTLAFGTIDDDSVLADIYGAADLLCLPSLEDNYPNTAIEARACGTPSLAFAVGGLPEIVEDGVTGLLAQPAGSVPALQEALLRFAQRHFRSETMRQSCRQAAERDNDPAAIGDRLKSLYEAALGRPIAPEDARLRAHVVKAFAQSPVRRDTGFGREFIRFPLNHAILDLERRRTQIEKFPVPAPARAPEPCRLITLRTHHAHHSARSGPYQFLRHLPGDAYAATHIPVPLGARFAGERTEFYRRAGALLGARAFGQQANAWLAETDLLALCASETVDLVHFIDGELGGWMLPSLPHRLFAGGRRPLLVTTFHQPPRVLRELVNAETLGRFDAVIALCAEQQRFLQDFADPSSVVLIPHGVDTDFFHPPPAGFTRAGPVLRLLLVGHWLRDIPSALAAFAAIAATMEAELTIISPNMPPARRDPRIKIRQGVSDEALREAYWSADMLLLPLTDATANNAILEAMACGLPVVATDIGGVREMTGEDAAVLCRPGDAAGLAAAVTALAADPARRARMAAAGRARAEKLDWSHVGARHHALYQHLLGRRTEVLAAAARGRGADALAC